MENFQTQKYNDLMADPISKLLIDYYGHEKSTKMMNITDHNNLKSSMKYVLDKDIGIDEPLTLEILENSIDKNKIPLSVINFDLLCKRDDKSSGHYIFFTGQDLDNFYYCDSGPDSYGKSVKLAKKDFFKLTKLCWHDYSTIII